MSEPSVYCGRGHHIPYTDFMHLIDLTFGFTTPETQFLGLLPKLYREERAPQGSNYVVTEGDTLCAAVGAYDHAVTVCGLSIPCRGIGNVAVHPDHRGKGYMQAAMNAALADMVADGIALSTLGGRRQRYQYFSYDKSGPRHSFWLNADNIRHTYGTLTAPYAVRAVTDSADPLLDGIKALSDGGLFAPVRSRADFLDIAVTWHARLLAVTDPDTENRLVGYCILEGKDSISEVRTAREEDFMPLLRSVAAFTESGGLSIRLPAYETAYLQALAPVAEGCQTGCSMSYSVLNYRLVTEAFLRLKTACTHLPDGEVRLLIHGFARDERLCLTVRDNRPTVTPLHDGASVDYELSHLEAMSVLFAPFSPLREQMSDLWRLWFPLPLWMYRADEV